MMEKKEPLPILNGVHLGEHSFVPELITKRIQEKCIDQGFNFVILSIRRLFLFRNIPFIR